VSRIAVIGGGAWGTALAIVLGRTGVHEVNLWAFEKEVCESVTQRRVNRLFLDGYLIPKSVRCTNDLGEALIGAHVVLSVMPSHHCRRLFESIAPHLKAEMHFVSATKGIENDSLLRMSQVIQETVKQRSGFEPKLAVLSGPSFAREVAKGDPTALTIASADMRVATFLQKEFSDPNFRLYANDDVAGVEIGGAVKNVIAIAAGVCDGMDLGHNSVAALITRGLAEITRLAVSCGAKPATMAGLAGLGDLVLTCTGGLSRNRAVGVELGKGRKLDEIIAGMHGMVAEGVLTTNATVGLAKKMNCEMPITSLMYAVLHDGKSPKEAVRELMTRPGKAE
jgi:glycerol-3-phosphate dehydrogenase (NAD(P)+)